MRKINMKQKSAYAPLLHNSMMVILFTLFGLTVGLLSGAAVVGGIRLVLGPESFHQLLTSVVSLGVKEVSSGYALLLAEGWIEPVESPVSITSTVNASTTSYGDPAVPGTSVRADSVTLAVGGAWRTGWASSGYDRVVVRVAVRCRAETCNVGPRQFRLLGTHGVYYSPENEDGAGYTMVQGGAMPQQLTFEVLEGDTNFSLVWIEEIDNRAFLVLP